MWFRLRRAMLYPLRISEHCMNVQNHYAKPSSTFPTTLLSWAPLSAPMFKMGKKRCLWFHCYHSHRRSHRLPRLWLVWNGKPSGTSLPYYPHMNSWTMWDLLPHHQQNKLSKTASPLCSPLPAFGGQRKGELSHLMMWKPKKGFLPEGCCGTLESSYSVLAFWCSSGRTAFPSAVTVTVKLAMWAKKEKEVDHLHKIHSNQTSIRTSFTLVITVYSILLRYTWLLFFTGVNCFFVLDQVFPHFL